MPFQLTNFRNAPIPLKKSAIATGGGGCSTLVIEAGVNAMMASGASIRRPPFHGRFGSLNRSDSRMAKLH
ncbi:hypothetical protein HF680_15190 [Brevundimonas sp. WCHBH090558]|nr:hypothetical protein [Brevundimonas huaxiensis]